MDIIRGRIIVLKVIFTNDSWFSWDRDVKDFDGHYVRAWVDFVNWFHNTGKQSFVIRFEDKKKKGMNTICRKDIKSFEISEKII